MIRYWGVWVLATTADGDSKESPFFFAPENRMLEAGSGWTHAGLR